MVSLTLLAMHSVVTSSTGTASVTCVPLLSNSSTPPTHLPEVSVTAMARKSTPLDFDDTMVNPDTLVGVARTLEPANVTPGSACVHDTIAGSALGSTAPGCWASWNNLSRVAVASVIAPAADPESLDASPPLLDESRVPW